MKKYKFECGCEIELISDEVKIGIDGLPRLHIDYENLPLQCPRAWSLYAEGLTKGVFQLETYFGQSWAKKLKPESIEHAAALISILRPGCMNSKLDGKSITQHYVDRKNGEEVVDYFHPALKPILESTYGCLIYQEGSLQIAKDIAGFNLQEADTLRKAIGKKKPEIMAKVKGEFLEGCKRIGKVNEKEAEEIFGWIEKSNRYAFNKSHAVSYAYLGYWTAWTKIHFPVHFYCSWLAHAKERKGKGGPQKEVRELVNDTHKLDVEVVPPRLDKIFCGDFGEFALIDNKVSFGIGSVKKIGKAQLDNLTKSVQKFEKEFDKPVADWTWYEFLVYFSDELSLSIANSIILVGALSFLKISRKQMLYEYGIWRRLVKRERLWVKNNCKNYSNIIDAMKMLSVSERADGGISNKNRREVVNSLITLLEENIINNKDDLGWITKTETELLGLPLTCTLLDSRDTTQRDTTCKEFSDGKTSKIFILCVEIVAASEYTINKGKNKGNKMGFLSVKDETAPLEGVVVFTNLWEKVKHELYEGATVTLSGYRSDRDSLVVKSVHSI